jgi:hypothetical protein
MHSYSRHAPAHFVLLKVNDTKIIRHELLGQRQEIGALPNNSNTEQQGSENETKSAGAQSDNALDINTCCN